MFGRRPAGETGVTPGGHDRRFPGYDVLGQVDTWDHVTAGVVLRRLAPTPALRFFTLEEQAVAEALFDQLLGQFDEPKVPVLQLVGARLAEEQTDGWRHVDMPPDNEAWHLTLRCLDEDARYRYARRLAQLSPPEQAGIVQAVQDLAAGAGQWHGWAAAHVWSLWTRYACAAFYAHPWAWNEIGYGGPAYPRGYKNLGVDGREPWEVRDHTPRDPVVWAERVEQARRDHGELARPRSRQPGPDRPEKS